MRKKETPMRQTLISHRTATLVAALLFGVCATAASAQSVLHVNASAAPGGDGITWQTAMASLQDALAAAEDADGAIEAIWVAQGTYRPAEPDGPRDATFQLVSGVALYGGFVGDETKLNQRDPEANVTILSGDLNDDDTDFGNIDDNSYNVVTATDADDDTRLDGFTIRGGNADGDTPLDRGGGIRIQGGSPLVWNCIIRDNNADVTGGGIATSAAQPIIVGCAFLENFAASGGAIGNRTSFTTVVNGQFFQNGATSGGAVYNAIGATLRIANCLFTGNLASSGGAINNNIQASAIVSNSTFSNNSADAGSVGGILNATASSLLTLSNSILWNNDANGLVDFDTQIGLAVGIATVDYTCIQGLPGDFPGNGNIADNPNFIDPAGPDDLLGTPDDDLRLASSSPCIDAAANSLIADDFADLDGDLDTSEPLPIDLIGNPRRIDVSTVRDTGQGRAPIVDMGAYETPEGPGIPGDINGDGQVDGADLALLLGAWGDCPGTGECPADLDGSGDVNGADLAILLGNWTG